jgi:hypothetical protein
MPASSIVALRKALRATLVADAALTSSLGGQKVYDETPVGVARPYLTFGEAQSRDWSASLSEGDEHIFEIIVWTDERGVRRALDLAAQIASILKATSPVLTGFRLINLSVTGVATRRDKDGRFARAEMRCRAVTETV